MLNGEAVGAKILDWKQEKDDMAASEEDKGSIMSILCYGSSADQPPVEDVFFGEPALALPAPAAIPDMEAVRS